jgi:hypothetical protein
VRRPAPVALAAVLLLVAGCGGRGDEATSPQKSTLKGPSRGLAEGRRSEALPRSHCPPDLPNCRVAAGRIVFVERVDPDGDGDAHFVIADPRGITLPGLTAIDVRVGLRPHPLPGPGDLMSAAGPVQTGSYGQRQIHALELHVAP